jgi:hypothetical protein
LGSPLATNRCGSSAFGASLYYGKVEEEIMAEIAMDLPLKRGRVMIFLVFFPLENLPSLGFTHAV